MRGLCRATPGASDAAAQASLLRRDDFAAPRFVALGAVARRLGSRMRTRADSRPLFSLVAACTALLTAGCPESASVLPPPDPNAPVEYLGAATCRACHSNIGELHQLHGHAQALKLTNGASPTYPTVSRPVGVPMPPDGFAWSDVDYVIGGYTKAADFVDTQGYVLTDGWTGVASQYNLANASAGLPAGFVSYLPDVTSPAPYTYSCFRCHTTGPVAFEDNGGRRQGNRPGIGGTWAEDGVQCEACHGPGSRHLYDPPAGNIVIDATANACRDCHSNPDNPTVLAASGGFIVGNQQYAEVQASPHAEFACTICHDPHASAIHDRSNGIRNECRDCHVDRGLALHTDRVYVYGDYTERLRCESCHMPLASRNASSATIGSGDSVGRVGDTRTHIMWVSVLPDAALVTPDGTRVVTDTDGHAAVPIEYVCLRCHHGQGSAFALTREAARAIADGIHGTP